MAVTVHGAVVAEIHPPSDQRPAYWTRDDFLRQVVPDQADAGLRGFLREVDQTTDDLGEPSS